MLQPDSLVFDLIVPPSESITPESIANALGGEEAMEQWLVIDADMDFPQYEQQMSPTLPLRRQGDRRVLFVDAARGPLRDNPQGPAEYNLDLRPSAELLRALVAATGARLGRMGSLGVWGDALVIADSLKGLRGWALLTWLIDPTIDEDGRRHPSPMGPERIEIKLMNFHKRQEELSDAQIQALPGLGPDRLRQVDGRWELNLLSPLNGHWQVNDSLDAADALAATDKFSTIPGAPYVDETEGPEAAPKDQRKPPNGTAAAPAKTPPAAATPEPVSGPAVAGVLHGDRVILNIPEERFGLDMITALGTQPHQVLLRTDPVSGEMRDRIYNDGFGFVAPLAFLSEVFVDGKPLSRPAFEEQATDLGAGIVGLEAHLPRFGPVRVFKAGDKRYVSSERDIAPQELLRLVGLQAEASR